MSVRGSNYRGNILQWLQVFWPQLFIFGLIGCLARLTFVLAQEDNYGTVALLTALIFVTPIWNAIAIAIKYQNGWNTYLPPVITKSCKDCVLLKEINNQLSEALCSEKEKITNV